MVKNSIISNIMRKELFKKINLKGFKGFTLAEVLITLVIIGVIAAMTIPTLINKTNNQEAVSRLKKTYSALSQATNKIISDNGLPRADIGGWATDVDAVYNLYKSNLQVSKECGSGSGCVPNGNYKHLKNSVSKNFNTYANVRKFVLSDGTSVIIEAVYPNCDYTSTDSGYTDVCASILVDINGNKGPRQVGRDLFAFVLKENGLYPAGCDIDNLCNNSHWGYACACNVIRENAMNY